MAQEPIEPRALGDAPVGGVGLSICVMFQPEVFGQPEMIEYFRIL
jgi:hypothetical protein